MPAYDPSNEDHERIAILAQQVAAQARAIVVANDYLGDPNRALHTRRTRLREALQATAEILELEQLCAAALGTTVLEEETDDTASEETA